MIGLKRLVKRKGLYFTVKCYKNFRPLDHLVGTYPNYVEFMYEFNMIFHMQMGLWITNIHENTIYSRKTPLLP